MEIEKLIAVLTELGIEQEKIDAIVAAMSDESGDKSPVEGEDGESGTSEGETSEEGTSKSEGGESSGKGEETVENQEGETAGSDSVPPVAPEETVPPVEGEIPPVAPEGEVVPPVPDLPPMISLEDFNQVKSELEETKKALEGVKAQCASLLEALQNAGVISGSAVTPVGNDSPSIPSTNKPDAMQSVLDEINRKRY